MNVLVDQYLKVGCMRCKYGATPLCKVLHWTEELVLLREIVLSTGLNEEIKWGMPVYTHQGKNIVSVNALKKSANISFFKGALLKDALQVLEQQGNIQAGRILRFTNIKDIEKIKNELKSYIVEAIEIEKSGAKVEIIKNPEPIPTELLEVFEIDEAIKKAFHNLTPGRQRGYIIYFSQPVQSKTRMSRIEKYKNQILCGKGMND